MNEKTQSNLIFGQKLANDLEKNIYFVFRPESGLESERNMHYFVEEDQASTYEKNDFNSVLIKFQSKGNKDDLG